MNLPGGHQHNLTPATSRSSPAFEPLKTEGTTGFTGLPPGVPGTAGLQPRTDDARRASEQIRLVKDMTYSSAGWANSPAVAAGGIVYPERRWIRNMIAAAHSLPWGAVVWLMPATAPVPSPRTP